MEPLFAQKRSLFSRLIGLVVVITLLIAADRWWLEHFGTRWLAGTIAKPFQQISIFPQTAIESVKEDFATREQLLVENARLKASQRILEAKVQKIAALTAENSTLRALLNSSAILGDDEIVVAELIGVSPDPLRHEIVINKGSKDAVQVGQPVLDAAGLMGQVTQVYRASSQVMLITDQRHQLPLQINRNGLRVIASGIGLQDELILMNVGSTADIRTGDLLVSSGLGGRFPVGYPVARVDYIETIKNSPFLSVRAKPLALLNRSRHVLLVFPRES